MSIVSSSDNEPPSNTWSTKMMENKKIRAQSSPAGQLSGWNSDSRLSDSVFSSSKIEEANSMSENRRENTQALSEFLMNKQPPPNNWVSHPSDDDQSLKRTASKMFRRRKNKTTKRPQLLKLPDSAIAATTTSGSRYIAISIPLEGMQEEKPSEEWVPARPQSQPRLPSERGTVTVLKPVVEARESSVGSSPSKSKDGNLGNRISRAESDMTATADILGPEATRTLENYYTQLSQQQKRDSTTYPRIAPSRSQRSYVAVLPTCIDNIARQESQRTNTTYSARTVDSTASMSSLMSHSRGESRASTAPSATVPVTRKLNLPPRNSSLNKIATAIQVELLHIGRPANDSPREDTQRSSILSIDGSMLSGTTATQSPTTTFCAAETGSPTIESHVQNATSMPKPPSPPPNKKLPDIPTTQVNSLSRQATLHPVQIKTVAPPQPNPSPPRKTTISANPEECTQVSPSRQDRVKARKLRDMAILRETSNAARLPAEDGAKCNRVPSQNSSHLTALPAKNPKRGSSSHRKKPPMTLSPVMCVASTEPSSPDIPIPTRRSARNSLDASKSLNIPHKLYTRTPRTPPHSGSVTPTFFGSDSETIPTSQKQVQHRASEISLSSSFLDSHRQERRARRNVSLKEKEMDARLKKVERDNMALMNTLSGIAMSFQELNMNRHHSKAGGKKVRGGGLLEGPRGGDSGDEAGIEA